MLNLRLRVICRDLPGIRFCGADGTVREPVYFGIQQRREVIAQVPADAGQAVFLPEFKVERGVGGAPNFLGPFAHGTPADRFFYLSWGVRTGSGGFEMFRRLKVRLGHLKWKQIETASRAGKPITVRLRLTDGCGGPLCATAKESHIEWQA
jgi:hypothetical protein